MLPTTDVKDREIWIRAVENRKCQVPLDQSNFFFFLAALIRERKRRKKQPYSSGAIPDIVLKALLELFKNWANHFANPKSFAYEKRIFDLISVFF